LRPAKFGRFRATHKPDHWLRWQDLKWETGGFWERPQVQFVKKLVRKWRHDLPDGL
jgi:hypothetical protein